MVERNIRIKKAMPCPACGGEQETTVYVDGRVDVTCPACGRAAMAALPGSLSSLLAAGRG